MRASRLPLSAFVVMLAFAPANAGAGAAVVAVVAGTHITNTATATYGSTAADTTQFRIASNTVVTVVAAVTAVLVGPSQTSCSVAKDSVDDSRPFVKAFTVSNVSNVADSYVATAITSKGTLQSIVVTAADGMQTTLVNGTALPPLAPGGTLRVAIAILAKSLPLGTTIDISLSVRSSVTDAANGRASATAVQCAITAGPAALTGTNALALPKLVDGVVSEAKSPGDPLTYAVAIRNSGGTMARNAVFSDPVPLGVAPIAQTATIGGVHAASTLSGNTLTVPLGDISPGQTVTIAFGATISDRVPLGTSLVNVAYVGAENVATLATDPASVFVGSDDVVYDGYQGQSEPVSGATVTLLDPITHLTIATHVTASTQAARTQLASASVHSASDTTPTSGTYFFGVSLAHAIVHFEIIITAASYRSRHIDVVLSPDATDTLYNVTLTALDGQLLARPGEFVLEPGPITIEQVYGVFGNLPLFRDQPLTISKTVDRQVASAGDRLEYTLTYANVGSALGATTLVDTLPPGVLYAPDTSRLDGKPLEPKRLGQRLLWTFETLTTSHTMTLAAIISPGVAAHSTLTNLATIASRPLNVSAGTISASATVTTTTVEGIFSDRTVLTGRVYVDRSDIGSFRRGDLGVPFVRLFLETGESVLTDGDGRFSFPGVKPGMHVLRLDASTLPPGVRPSGDRSYDSERSTRRLIHGVFDGGVMEDTNFAVESVR